jgi:hypothetical protein
MLPFEKSLNYRKDNEDYYYVLYLLHVSQNWISFLLNIAWLGHNSVSIKTSFTKLTINFILT